MLSPTFSPLLSHLVILFSAVYFFLLFFSLKAADISQNVALVMQGTLILLTGNLLFLCFVGE